MPKLNEAFWEDISTKRHTHGHWVSAVPPGPPPSKNGHWGISVGIWGSCIRFNNDRIRETESFLLVSCRSISTAAAKVT